MSSILRALKKLESNPGQTEEIRPVNTGFVPLADTDSQKKPASLLLLLIGGSILSGLIILAGWWYFSGKNQLPPGAPGKIEQQSLQAPETSPAKHAEPASSAPPAIAEESIPKTTEPAAEAVMPAKPEIQLPKPAAMPVPKPAPTAIAQKKAMSFDEPMAQATAQAPETPGPEAVSQPPAAEPAAAPAVPAPPEKTAEPEIPLLNDPEMKLQAITWSRDPQKRIVVINNRIVRQGEVVHGYHLDLINQDDIVLSAGGEKWRLLFRIK